MHAYTRTHPAKHTQKQKHDTRVGERRVDYISVNLPSRRSSAVKTQTERKKAARDPLPVIAMLDTCKGLTALYHLQRGREREGGRGRKSDRTGELAMGWKRGDMGGDVRGTSPLSASCWSFVAPLEHLKQWTEHGNMLLFFCLFVLWVMVQRGRKWISKNH